MAEVGDRIVVTSKGQPRFGAVTSVGRSMISVKWDAGPETSIVPGPGVFSVVPPNAVTTNSAEELTDAAGADGNDKKTLTEKKAAKDGKKNKKSKKSKKSKKAKGETGS